MLHDLSNNLSRYSLVFLLLVSFSFLLIAGGLQDVISGVNSASTADNDTADLSKSNMIAGPEAQVSVGTGSGSSTSAQKSLADMPVFFIPNKGQVDSAVSYYASGAGYNFYLTKTGITYAFQRDATEANAQDEPVKETYTLSIGFAGANTSAAITAADEQDAKVNYLIGNDESKWQTGLSTYGAVTYSGLYPGVDLTYTGDAKKIKYAYTVAPGASYKQIGMTYSGASSLRTDKAGNLLIATPWGDLKDERPVAFQMINGTRVPVDAAFAITGTTVGFTLGSYNAAYPLVIDPGIEYSTFLGGSGADIVYDITVDATGDAYLTGSTFSTDLPVSTPTLDSRANGGEDVFVAKLNSDASDLLYMTYIGGSLSENGRGIRLTASGDIVIAGTTNSYNFPCPTPAFDRTLNDIAGDAFVLKLNSTGRKILASTLIGGNYDNAPDEVIGLEVDASGDAYIAGQTSNVGNGTRSYPVSANAYDTTPTAGEVDNFVSRLNPQLTQVKYSSYFDCFTCGTSIGPAAGAPLLTAVIDFTIDNTGNVILAGTTNNALMPTSGDASDCGTIYDAFDLPCNEITGDLFEDAFVAKIDTSTIGAVSSNDLVFSRYIGGMGVELGLGVAVDSSDNVYVVGNTDSCDFLLGGTGEFDDTQFNTCLNGLSDAFVVKLDPATGAQDYSKRWGGISTDRAVKVQVNDDGVIFVGGDTQSDDFPVTSSALDKKYDPGAASEIWFSKLDPAEAPPFGADDLIFSTYFGWKAMIVNLYSVFLDPNDFLYVAGSSSSFYYPTTPNAFDQTCGTDGKCNDTTDGVVTKLDLTDGIFLPTTNIHIDPPSPNGRNGWYVDPASTDSGQPEITLVANKPDATAYFQWNATSDTGWTAFFGPFAPLVGSNDLYYYSKDEDGNKSSIGKVTLKYDPNQPSDPQAETDPDNSKPIFSESPISVTFNLLGTNDLDVANGILGSGVDYYNYAICVKDGGCLFGPASLDGSIAQVQATLDVGSYEFSIDTVDMAGNHSGGSCNDIDLCMLVIAQLTITDTDTASPDDPTFVESTSHSAGIPSTNTSIDMIWSGATDDLSGVDGFSYIFSTGATDVPDKVKDAEETATSDSSGPLADGTYYFHLRTVDNKGNWSSNIVHRGPYIIDTLAPVTTSATDPSSANGHNDWFKTEATVALETEDSATTYYQWDSTSDAEAYTVSTTTNAFTGTGTPLDIRGDDVAQAYGLPFAFPFYDGTFTTVYLSSNGLLTFGGPNVSDDNSDLAFEQIQGIAPLWDDFRTNGHATDDIYVFQPDKNSIGFRWQARTFEPGDRATNFEVILSKSGDIRFNYGEQNGALTPTIGISNGDGLNSEIIFGADYLSSYLFTKSSWRGFPGFGWTVYSGAIPMLEDVHTLYYYSVDQAGNKEATNSLGLKKDTVLPIDPALTSTTHQINEWTTSDVITVEWTGATDDSSGVDGYSFEWSNLPLASIDLENHPDSTKDAEEGAFTATSPPLEDGTWYFHLRTKDNAGHWTTNTNIGPFNILKGSPTSTYSILPSIPDGDEGWYKQKLDNENRIITPKITLTANGNSQIFYQWNSTSDLGWIPYSSTIELLQGENVLYFYAVAQTGAAETPNSAAFNYDPVLPLSTEYSSSTHSVGIPSRDQQIELELSISPLIIDDVSGVDHYNYRFHPVCDAKQFTSSIPTTSTSITSPVLDQGTWFLLSQAVDNAGNVGPVSCSGPYIIDLAVATTDISVTPQPNDGHYDWYKSTPAITLTKGEEGTLFYKWDSSLDATGYYHVETATQEISSGGTQLDIRGDDVASEYPLTSVLPNGFNFFGATYDSVFLSSNGLITFDAPVTDHLNSESKLKSLRAIAPLWDDYRTDGHATDDIYVSTGDSWVSFRWQSRNYSFDDAITNFEVILYEDGRIRLNYGAQEGTISATTGISNGDGQAAVSSDVTSSSSRESTIFEPAQWNIYTSTIPGIDGQHTLYYYLVDTAGNIETLRSYDQKVDTILPENPTAFTSCPNVLNTPASTDVININWSGASDTPSGIDGYSYEWSTLPPASIDTENHPDSTMDVQETVTSATLDAPADGTWYFYVRVKDNAGHWSTGTSYGPFVVESGAPQADCEAPETIILTGPSGTIASKDVTFTWTGTDNVTASGDLLYSFGLKGLDIYYGPFGPDTTVSYSNLPNGTYTFKVRAQDSTGNIDQTSAELTFTVDAKSLTVDKDGTGSGKVVSSPTGIDCGSDCYEVYGSDTSVTLTASADPGSYFAGWSGEGCVGTSDCVVLVEDEHNVTATFNRIPGTVRVESSNTGLITYSPSCWSVYSSGSMSSGEARYAKTASCNAQFTFDGLEVAWIAPKAKQLGIAKVYMDGVFQANVDLYAATASYQQNVYNATFPTPGVHTIKVEATGTKNGSAKNSYVVVDAFDVTN